MQILQSAASPVDQQLQRILRAITTRHASGMLAVPSAVLTRIFQELSSGMLAYNHASKLKEVPPPTVRSVISVTAVTAVTAQPGAPHHHQAPLPFAYVQFNALRKRYIRYIRHIRYIRYLLNQVPLPFAYVQFNALLLHLFALVAPIGVCCFTESLSFAVITRWCDALAIGREGALWRRALEHLLPIARAPRSSDRCP